MFSDNGPAYDSEEFEKFAKDWDFVHSTSSPHYPRSNGLAERTVRTVKQMFKKCKDSKQDPLLALLNYRDTPLECGYSPSQLLMHRSLRTTLPDGSRSMSETPNSEEVVQHKVREKCRQKHYYDQKAQPDPLPPLTPGNTVRVRTSEQANWSEQGEIVDMVNPRSYVVKTTKGSVYRRNRCHLLKTDSNDVEGPKVPPDTPSNLVVNPLPSTPPPTNSNDNISTPPNVGQNITRLGRVIHKPKRLIEEIE